MTLSELSTIAKLLSNDMECIANHATGESLQDITQRAEAYAMAADEDSQLFSKYAIANGEEIKNKSLPGETIDLETQWEPVEGRAYSYKLFLETANELLNKYVDLLTETINEIEDPIIKSVLCEIGKFWELEAKYTLPAMLAPEPMESDFYDLLDNDEEMEDDNELDAGQFAVDFMNNLYANANNFNWDKSDLKPMNNDMIISGGEEIKPEEKIEDNSENDTFDPLAAFDINGTTEENNEEDEDEEKTK